MRVTDEMVERATVQFEKYWRSSGDTGESFTEAVRSGVRAALEAALGDVEPEPLEDVLGHGYWVSITTKRTDDTWIAIVGDHDTGIKTNGYGPTIDAAVRNAVANATKGGEG